ncbi:hypothetical protein ACO11K_000684 [Bacillus cytotoxicus]|nr:MULTISPECIES: hypothetical protein [unclassified Bacillus cereus group]
MENKEEITFIDCKGREISVMIDTKNKKPLCREDGSIVGKYVL